MFFHIEVWVGSWGGGGGQDGECCNIICFFKILADLMRHQFDRHDRIDQCQRRPLDAIFGIGNFHGLYYISSF